MIGCLMTFPPFTKRYKRFLSPHLTASRFSKERVQFLLPYVEGMSSPVQVGPIASLLVETEFNSKELLILGQAFVLALKKIDGDDRSFSLSLNEDRTVKAIMKLIGLLRNENSSIVNY